VVPDVDRNMQQLLNKSDINNSIGLLVIAVFLAEYHKSYTQQDANSEDT
jgi:hypothetical protein